MTRGVGDTDKERGEVRKVKCVAGGGVRKGKEEGDRTGSQVVIVTVRNKSGAPPDRNPDLSGDRDLTSWYTKSLDGRSGRTSPEEVGGEYATEDRRGGPGVDPETR